MSGVSFFGGGFLEQILIGLLMGMLGFSEVNASELTVVDAAPDATPTLTRSLQSALDDIYRRQRVSPGMTAAFVLSDGRSGAVAAGFLTPRKDEPMRPAAHMLSGSIGKTYVSALLLKLIGEHKAHLGDMLHQYLGAAPWYPRLPNGPTITLRSLLNHTSGLHNHVSDARFEADVRKSPGRTWTPAELIGYDLDLPPLGPVGTVYQYSDTNYLLLGLVIEKITGREYYVELRDRILRPLGLRETTPSNEAVIPGLVDGFTSAHNPFGLPAKVCMDGRDALNPQIEWTGGGLVSNALDLARWGHYLYGGKVLTPKLLQKMLTTVAQGKANPAYGLGVYEWHTALGTAYGHQGDFPGYWSVLQYFPAYHLSLAMQFNTDDEEALQDLPLKYSEELAGVVARNMPLSRQEL